MFTRIYLRTFEHFVEVARLIAGDNAPEWLPRLLHSWMCDLHRARFVDSQRPTRTRMRQRLDRCEAAAWLLSEELASTWVPEFLEADSTSSVAQSF